MNPPRARAFGSLRSRNVRLFLGGQSVSLVGTWIQQVAMGWLAYRLTGSPLLLGVLAAAGAGVCFIVNGPSYAAVLAALVAMRTVPEAPPRPATPILAGLRATARYARSTPPIAKILVLVALVTLLGRPYTVLLPVFAAEVLYGGPQTLGWLMAASGCGALVGTLALSGRRSLDRSATTIAFGAAVAGAALVLFAFSDALWLSLALMFATGLGVMLQLASSNALIQTVVADDRRGQVMGLYTMAFVGLAPVGTLLAGTLATSFGAARTVLLGGFCCLAGSLAFARRLSGGH